MSHVLGTSTSHMIWAHIVTWLGNTYKSHVLGTLTSHMTWANIVTWLRHTYMSHVLGTLSHMTWAYLVTWLGNTYKSHVLGTHTSHMTWAHLQSHDLGTTETTLKINTYIFIWITDICLATENMSSITNICHQFYITNI